MYWRRWRSNMWIQTKKNKMISKNRAENRTHTKAWPGVHECSFVFIHLKTPMCGLQLFLRFDFGWKIRTSSFLISFLALAPLCSALLLFFSIWLSMGRQMHTHSCRIYCASGVWYTKEINNITHTSENEDVKLVKFLENMMVVAVEVVVFDLFLEKQSTKNQ